MHNIFYMSLSEQDTTRKKWVDDNMTEIETGDSKKYKVEVICKSKIYANKQKDYLQGLYYLIT